MARLTAAQTAQREAASRKHVEKRLLQAAQMSEASPRRPSRAVTAAASIAAKEATSRFDERQAIRQSHRELDKHRLQYRQELTKLREQLGRLQAQNAHNLLASQQEQHRHNIEIQRLLALVDHQSRRAAWAEACLAQAHCAATLSAEEVRLLRSQVRQRDQVIADCQIKETATRHKLWQTTNTLQKRTKLLAKLRPKLKQKGDKMETVRKRACRAKDSRPMVLEKGIERAKHFQLKNKGVYMPRVRMGVARLHAHGISAKSMPQVLKIAAKLFGGDLEHTLDRRDVARFTAEAGVLADLQIMDDTIKAPSLTASGDGSSFRNIPHESRHVYLAVPYQKGAPEGLVTRTLGVTRATNHTLQTQMDGWVKTVEALGDRWNRSPLGQDNQIDAQGVFTSSLSAYKSDHSPDQDLLADMMKRWKQKTQREISGKQLAKNMTNSEILSLYAEKLHSVIAAHPDSESLSNDQLDTLVGDAWRALFVELGQKDFDALPAAEQVQIEFFVRVGCAMHKDLNWTKAGDAAMRAAYDELDLDERPIKLPNKATVEAQAAEQMSKGEKKLEAAEKFAGKLPGKKCDAVVRGGVPAVGHAAAILNHKDNNRGEQDTWRLFMESKIGVQISFPDASNTRYGSNTDGATVLIVHRDLTIEYLDKSRRHKASQLAGNIVINVSNALQDPPTLTELVVLGAYGQAISRPFMAYVRANNQSNSLLMKPVYEGIIKKTEGFIENPDLALGEDATPLTGSIFQSSTWDSPVFFEEMHKLRREGLLPNLEALWVAFCKGALKAMKRFTREYADNGLIAQLTPKRQKRGRTTLTNDENEGALAAANEYKNKNPTMSEFQQNSLYKIKMNHTNEWQRNILDPSPQAPATYKFAMVEGRAQLASGHEKHEREEYMKGWNKQIDARDQHAAEARGRKAEREKKMAAISLIKSEAGDVDVQTLMKLNVEKLNEQIDKLRSINVKLIATKNSFKGKIDGKPPKQRKCEAIAEALKEVEKLDPAEIEEEGDEEAEADIEPNDDEAMLYDDEIL